MQTDSQAAAQEQGTLPDSTRFLGRADYCEEPEEKTGELLILALVYELRRTTKLLEDLYPSTFASRPYVTEIAIANYHARAALSRDDESDMRGAFLTLSKLR